MHKQFHPLPPEYSTDIRWRLNWKLFCLSIMTCWSCGSAPATSTQTKCCFQHDWMPPHIHNEVTTFLNRQLPQQWICWWGGGPLPGLHNLQIWPLLTFFLWGFVKDEVYIPPMPIMLNNLKEQIWTAPAKTDKTLLQNVSHEVRYHSDVCRVTNGAHTELPYGMKKTFFFSSCSLQWCMFNFCVAITFLPIHLCNDIICNHPVL
jgi:hypothetical protein